MHPVRPAAFHRKRLTMQVRKRSLVDRHEQDPNAFGLLLARRFQGATWFAAAASHFHYRFQESARRISSFVHEGFVFVEGFVAGGLGFVVADVTIEQGHRAGGDEFHVDQPVGQRGADALGADGVAVGDDGEDAAFKMFRVTPAF